MACQRSWSSSHRGWRRGPPRTGRRSCCLIRIARDGIRCTSCTASPPWNGRKRPQPGWARTPSRLRSRHATPELRQRATDWVRIAELYEQLVRLTGSPVVEVNRAVALSMAYGPQAGLALLDQLEGLPALRGYHLLASVRGDLLDKLGQREEARAEFARAATMTQNEREQKLLLSRAGDTS